MKQLFTFLLATSLCLYGCSQSDADGDPTTKAVGEYVSGTQIFLSPFTPDNRPTFENNKDQLILNFDKNGGQTTVTAYFPEEDEVKLNEDYTIGHGDIPQDKISVIGSQVQVKKAKLDDFRSEYVITVNQNNIGTDYDIYIDLRDASKIRNKKGDPLVSKARITIHQTVD